MRNAFIEELTSVSGDPRVFTLLADNGIIVFDEYKRLYPKQLLNVGIAESNMIGVAAGMSTCGFIPFVYTIIPFLVLRTFEYIRNDLCEQNLNVKLVGIGAGLAYSTLGPTHHATEDIAAMRCLPNITIISPADPLETKKAVRAAYALKGPVYLRIGTGKNPNVNSQDYNFTIGKGSVLKDGCDITIISTGSILCEVMQAAEVLAKEKISTRVINMHTLKPLDEEIILKAAQETKAILTVEEHTIFGGLGSSVAEVIAEKNKKFLPFKRLGLKGIFCQEFGSIQELRRLHGIAKEDIVKEAALLL
jgi:transketolase